MAKGIYDGIGSTAKKVKSLYVGIGGVPKKVKRVYAGVAGVPRLCYSADQELSYYGTLAASPVSNYGAAATVGGYAIFAGNGYNSSYGWSSIPTAYTKDLVKASVPEMNSTVNEYVSGSGVGNYAVFAGGGLHTDEYNTKFDAYTSALVHTSGAAANFGHWEKGTAEVGNYAIFAGGRKGSAIRDSVTIAQGISNQLVITSVPNLPCKASKIPAVSMEAYALFAYRGYTGTTSSSAVNTRRVYSAALVSTDLSAMSCELPKTAAKAGSCAVVIGRGLTDIYSASLVHSTLPAVSTDCTWKMAFSTEELAVFPGHAYGTCIIDKNLVQKSCEALSTVKADGVSAYVGNRGICYGESVLDIYTRE